MSERLTARHLMHADVLTVEPEMSLAEAWDLFRSHRIGGAPVVSAAEGLVGVLSQSDLLRVTLEGELEDFPPRSYYLGVGFWDSPVPEKLRDRLEALTVEDAMNPRVITAGPDDSAAALATTMRNNDIHRIIVVEDGKVTGIVTALDLLTVLENH